MLRSLILIKSISTNKVKQKGAAFIEFILVFLLIILPFTVFTVNLGRLLWQTQTLSDFARESVRYASRLSDTDPTKTCDELESAAGSAADFYLISNSAWGFSGVWSYLAYRDATRVFRANNASGPSARIKMMNVVYKTVPNSNCLFCANTLFNNFDIWVISKMDISSRSICANS